MNEAVTREAVTTTEAMKILGISRATVTRMIRRGDLAAYRLTLQKHSPLRIYRDSIETVIARRQVV